MSIYNRSLVLDEAIESPKTEVCEFLETSHLSTSKSAEIQLKTVKISGTITVSF